MFSAYQKLLHTYPLPTKMITCGIICSLADCITQTYVHKNEKFNFKRNLNLFLVGALYTAPMLHIWHSKLIPIISDYIFTSKTAKIRKVLTLVTLDQLAFVPVLLSGFFVWNGVVNSFSVEGLKDGLKSWKQRFWEALCKNWTIWPFATTVNFWFVPITYRVLFSNFIGFFWNIILSYIAYDEKVAFEQIKPIK